jgi:putative ABC transport system substrate-binding protein
MLIANAKAVAGAALRHRLPSIAFREVAEAGGLLSYGVNLNEMFRRSAVFVDKLLKGAKAGDIPVEQSTRFELVFNRRTAKALGVTIPENVLVLANKVIE